MNCTSVLHLPSAGPLRSVDFHRREGERERERDGEWLFRGGTSRVRGGTSRVRGGIPRS